MSFPFRKLYAWVDSHVPDKKELEEEEDAEAETDAERDDEIDDEEQASRLQDSSLTVASQALAGPASHHSVV